MHAAIVGISHTEYSRDSGRSELKLACEAIAAAMRDAALRPDQVDGIAKYTMDNNDPVEIARCLGLPRLRFFGEVPYGGGRGPGGTVLMMAMAARRHMNLYGTEPRHFGEIARICRNHATLNPDAPMYGKPRTLEHH